MQQKFARYRLYLERCVSVLEFRYPDQYFSFKVTVYRSNMKGTLMPKKWPLGAFVYYLPS